MTTEEVKTVVSIMIEADGGCPNCVFQQLWGLQEKFGYSRDELTDWAIEAGYTNLDRGELLERFDDED
jgi:hypothetical protein